MTRRIERVAICGVGAVGGSYAARFHDLDPGMLLVVAGGPRRERLLRQGLTVNGRTIAVRCLEPGEPAPPADLLLFAVKRHQLAQAISDAGALVGAGTIVMSLLNGITNEEALAAEFGDEKVLRAFTLGNDVVREGGTTVRYTRFGRLVFGGRSNDPADPRVVAVKELLDRAGIPYEVPADILRAQWFKFMLNVGVNQVSAILRARYGEFAFPEVQDLMRRAALEVVAVSGPEGVGLDPADVEQIFRIAATLAPDGKTSTLQDVEAGRKTEVEIFAGTVVDLGRRHGVPTPVNALLQTMIRALERMAGVAG